VDAGFLVNGDLIGAGLNEERRVAIRVSDHEVDVESEAGGFTDRFDDGDSDGEIGYEMAVHDIEMEQRSPSAFDGGDLLAQSRKICGEDRRNDLSHLRSGDSFRWYHGSVKAVPGVEARGTPHFSRRRVPQHGPHDILIFLTFERAGGVHEEPAGREVFQSAGQKPALQLRQRGEVSGFDAPADLGVTSKGAGSRAGGVDENAIEFGVEGERGGGVEDDEGDSGGLEVFETIEVDVAGDGTDSRFERLSGLVARGGAEIQKCLTGLEIEQRNDGLGAGVLDAEALGAAGDEFVSSGNSGSGFEFRGFGERGAGRDADPDFGLVEEGAGDFVGHVGAELIVPTVQHPGGHGEVHPAFRETDRVAVDLSQDGIYEAGGGGFSIAFDQFDAFADGGVGRNAVEHAHLVYTHAEGDADGGVLDGGFAVREEAEEEVQLALAAEAAEDEFGGEAGIAGIEAAGGGHEEVRGVGSGFGAAEDVERDEACGADGWRLGQD
jgi:hypothetical protein